MMRAEVPVAKRELPKVAELEMLNLRVYSSLSFQIKHQSVGIFQP